MPPEKYIVKAKKNIKMFRPFSSRLESAYAAVSVKNKFTIVPATV